MVDRDIRPGLTSGTPELTSSSTLRCPEDLSSGAGTRGVEDEISDGSKRKEGPCQLERISCNFEYLRHAKLDPPVTKVALSELDLERIINNPKLRHDLNFDSIVAFRPNVDGSHSKRKAAEAKKYWDALAVELELYINRQGPTHQVTIDRRHQKTLCSSPNPLKAVLIRLPRMFVAIREILQTLIPQDQLFTIEVHLDMDMLGRELENGVCDFVRLIEWLGSMLIGSCSPLRDDLILSMTAELKRGVCSNDPQTIVGALRSLFGILEMMRLDIANHQIRYLRLFMIEDTVDFEQRYFLKKIANGWNVARAHAWYQAPLGIPASDASSQASRLLAFAEDIVDMVVSGHTRFPATFVFDFKRLRLLQGGFRECKQQQIYTQVFCKLAERTGWTGQIPPESIHSLLRRTYVLRDSEKIEMISSTSIDSIALEIVRETAKLCQPSEMPDEQLVKDTKDELQNLSITASSNLEDWDHPLCYNLAEMAEQKVTAIMGLNPLQMQNHFLAKIPKVELGPVEAALDEIAQTIAHIAVLHWRVWVPILYENPSYASIPGTHTCNGHLQSTASSISQPSINKAEVQVVGQPPTPKTQCEESEISKSSASDIFELRTSKKDNEARNS